MADKTMVAKLILDASTYQKSIQIAKAETTTIKKEMELWMVENNKTRDSLSGLVKQVKTNADTQKILSAEIARTKQQHAEVSEKMGVNSTAAVKLKNNLLDMQIAQAKLNKEVGGGLTPLQNFKNGLTATGEQLQKAGDKMVSVGRSLSTYVTAPMIAVGTATVKMAMDAIESENLFEVSMGKNAAAARKWSEGLQESLGLNEYAVRKNVSTFNVMLDSMGMGSKASYDMAAGLTQLSYDMSSFYNLKPEEAFLKLQSGISGEIEPLKRLGIVVNETTTKTYAYTHGIAKQGDELSEQQKILARYGVIMDATGKAQGDLARTIDSPTNQIRILGEQVKQLGIDFGMQLIPVVGTLIEKIKPFVEKLKNLVEWFKNLQPEQQKMIEKLILFAVAGGPALVFVGNMAKAVNIGLIPALKGLFSTTGVVVSGILLIAATALYAIGTFDKFKERLDAISKGQRTHDWNLAAAKEDFESGKQDPFMNGPSFGQGVLDGIKKLIPDVSKITDMFKGLGDAFNTTSESADELAIKMRKAGAPESAIQSMLNAKKATNDYADSNNNLINTYADLYNAQEKTAKQQETAAKKQEAAMNKAADSIKKSYAPAIDALESQIKRLLVPTEDLKQQLSNQQQAMKLTQQEIDKLNEEYGKMVKAHAETSTAALDVKNKIEAEKTALIELGNKAADTAQKMKQSMIDNMNDMNSAIKSALQRRYESEKTMLERSIDEQSTKLERWKNDQLDAIQKVHDAAIMSLDADTKKQVDALQSQIDAIDSIQTATERAQNEKQRDDKVAALREKLAAEMDAEKKIEILKDLNEAIADAESQRLKNSQDAQIDSLRKQIETIKDAAEDKKTQLDIDFNNQQDAYNADYEAQKRNLDDKKTANDRFYQDKLDSAAIEAEAEKLMLDKNQKEMIELLNSYGDPYKTAGKTLGESFFEGFKTWAAQVAELIANVSKGIGTPNVSSGGGGTSTTITPTKHDYEQYLDMNSNLGLPDDYYQRAGTASDYYNPDSGMTRDQFETTLRGYAEGTKSAAPGLAWVGEKGPELISFKGGESVVSNNKLGGNTIHVTITGNTIANDMDINTIGDKFVSFLKSKGIRLATPY